MQEPSIDLTKPSTSLYRFDQQFLAQTVIEPIQSKLLFVKQRHDDYLNLLQTYLKIRQGSDTGQQEFEYKLQEIFVEFKEAFQKKTDVRYLAEKDNALVRIDYERLKHTHEHLMKFNAGTVDALPPL